MGSFIRIGLIKKRKQLDSGNAGQDESFRRDVQIAFAAPGSDESFDELQFHHEQFDRKELIHRKR